MSFRRLVTVIAAVSLFALYTVPAAQAQEKKPDPAATKEKGTPDKDKTAGSKPVPVKDKKPVAREKKPVAKGKDDPVRKKTDAAKGKVAPKKDKKGAGKTGDAESSDKNTSTKKDVMPKEKDAAAKDKEAVRKARDKVVKGKAPAKKTPVAVSREKAAPVKDKAATVKDNDTAAAKAKEGKFAATVKGNVKSIDLDGKAIMLNVPSEKDDATMEQTFKFGPDLRVMVLGKESASIADIQPGMRAAVVLTAEKTVMGIKAMAKDGQAGVKGDRPADKVKKPDTRQDQPVKKSDKAAAK